MPLKHLTETILVAALGAVLILTGILLPTLPSLPEGILPWMLLFFLTLLYPLALYPLFKRNRADNAFRLLHFLPAALAVIWLVLQILLARVPTVAPLLHGFLFAWTLPGVAVSFLFIVIFVLRVIRRRVPRLTFLALLFLPFVLLSTLGEAAFDGQKRIAAVLWQGNWWDITGARSSRSSLSSRSASSRPVIASSRGRPVPYLAQSSSSSRPKRLPSAGPELPLLAGSVLALSLGRMQGRAVRRRL